MVKIEHEIEAMRAIAEALDRLDADAVDRVLRWAVDRYGVEKNRPPPRSGERSHPRVDEPEEPVQAPVEEDEEFSDFADFFFRAAPSTQAEQALVAGYWFQEMENNSDLDARTVNTALKDLGHSISNITRAFNQLQKSSPTLVMKVRKTGTTQQARNRYRLTEVGKRRVRRLLATDR